MDFACNTRGRRRATCPSVLWGIVLIFCFASICGAEQDSRSREVEGLLRRSSEQFKESDDMIMKSIKPLKNPVVGVFSMFTVTVILFE